MYEHNRDPEKPDQKDQSQDQLQDELGLQQQEDWGGQYLLAAVRPATSHDVRRVLGSPALINKLWKELGDPSTSTDDKIVITIPVDGKGARIKVRTKADSAHSFPEAVILPVGSELVRIPIEAHNDLDEAQEAE